MEYRSGQVTFGTSSHVPDDVISRMLRNEEAIDAARRSVTSAVESVGDIDIELDYLGEPVIRRGEKKRLRVSIHLPDGSLSSAATLKTPPDWEVTDLEPGLFDISPGSIAPRNVLTVLADTGTKQHSVQFTILSTQEAKGFPGNKNVERCQKCNARKDSCLCDG